MNTQLILVLAWLASLVVVGGWQNASGHAAERLAVTQRDLSELATANEKITTMTNKMISDNAEHATRLSMISQQFEKEKQDETKKLDRVIADLRAERIRLRDPGSTSTTGKTGDEDATTTGKCDGETRGYLSKETSEFLVSLTGEADEVARQLTHCQEVVMDYQRCR